MPTVQKPIAKSAPRPAGKPIAKTAAKAPTVQPPQWRIVTQLNEDLLGRVPLCTDCARYSSDAGKQSCSSPRNGVSLVTGQTYVLNPETCRAPGTEPRQCGRLGANFVAKPVVEVKRAWWRF